MLCKKKVTAVHLFYVLKGRVDITYFIYLVLLTKYNVAAVHHVIIYSLQHSFLCWVDPMGS